MKYIKPGLLFFLVTAFLVSCTTSKRQENVPVDINTIVESKSFTFKAETARPIRGGNRQLTGAYDLSIKPNRIVAYLPFFGRAQTIPPGTADGGINFTSNNFDYNVVRQKKSWGITIKPNDVSHVKQLYLTIYGNGTATLDVMNIYRDDISFSGYIK